MEATRSRTVLRPILRAARGLRVVGSWPASPPNRPFSVNGARPCSFTGCADALVQRRGDSTAGRSAAIGAGIGCFALFDTNLTDVTRRPIGTRRRNREARGPFGTCRGAGLESPHPGEWGQSTEERK